MQATLQLLMAIDIFFAKLVIEGFRWIRDSLRFY